VDVLKEERNMLQNLVLNLHKDSISTMSNHIISIKLAQVDPKEEDIVHQPKEVREVD